MIEIEERERTRGRLGEREKDSENNDTLPTKKCARACCSACVHVSLQVDEDEIRFCFVQWMKDKRIMGYDGVCNSTSN